MRVQDLIVRQTQRALGDLIRAVEALPEDKRDWRPMYEGRSALDQLREAAWAPMFYKSFLGSEGFGAGMGGNHDEVRKKAGEPMSFDDGREQALRETGELCSLIAAFPDEKLDEEVTLPVGGGMVLTMAEVLGVHYWNLVYHQGQVNYIQTLLGDREMH